MKMTVNTSKIQTIFDGKIIKFKENPFLEGFSIKTKKKRVVLGGTSKVILNTETGEVEDIPHIAKIWEVDNDQYVKIFTSMIKHTFELESAGHKVFYILIRTLGKTAINKDEIYLSWSEAEEFIINHKVKISQATFFRGLKDCIKNSILAKSARENIYFINPRIVFNGDRTIFSYVIEKKKQTQSNTVLSKQESNKETNIIQEEIAKVINSLDIPN